MQYLSDAKHQAKTAGVGLALKKGTKNNLGLVGITLKNGDEGLIRKRWVVRGAPNMTPSTFQEFLKKEDWRRIDEIQHPNGRNGLWVFEGVSPSNLPSVGFVRNYGDSSKMIFSPWIAKTQKTVSVPIEHKRSWATVVSNVDVTSDTPQQQFVPKDTEVPPTLSILRTLLKLKTRIWAMANERLRTLPKVNNHQKFEKLKAWLTRTFMLRVPMACPLGTWAATGTAGSVALQRLAAYLNEADKKKQKKYDVASIAEKLALSLRVKTTMFLKGGQAWRENWWPDPECSQTTEAGPPSTNLSEYLECISRPKPYDQRECREWLFFSRDDIFHQRNLWYGWYENPGSFPNEDVCSEPKDWNSISKF